MSLIDGEQQIKPPHLAGERGWMSGKGEMPAGIFSDDPVCYGESGKTSHSGYAQQFQLPSAIPIDSTGRKIRILGGGVAADRSEFGRSQGETI